MNTNKITDAIFALAKAVHEAGTDEFRYVDVQTAMMTAMTESTPPAETPLKRVHAATLALINEVIK